MVIDLVPLNREIVFEETLYLAYGDIYNYMYNTEVYDINHDQHIIDAFNNYTLDAETTKQLNEKLLEEIPDSRINAQVNELVDDCAILLDEVKLLENAEYSIFIENSELTLEVSAITPELDVSKILLQFEIHENMTPEYLSKMIAEEVQMQYELPFEIEYDLNEVIDKADNKLNVNDMVFSDIDSALKPLQKIAEERTGRSGLQFNVATEIKEGYCDFERGTIDMKGYLDDVLKSFRDTKVDHQSCMELLEVVYLYSEQVGLDIYSDFKWFDELHYYVLEDIMKELTSSETEYLNLNLEFNIDDFSDKYKKILNEYSHIVMTNLYGDYVDNLNLTEVYFYEENSINLRGAYKFINKENSVCLENVNWLDLNSHTDLSIDELRSKIEWLKEEYELDYSNHLNLIDVHENGNLMENTYWDGKGLFQSTLEKFYKIMPRTGQFIGDVNSEDIQTCLKIHEIYCDLNNNGLSNIFEIPDFNHWEQFHSEYLNEFGEVEEEEDMPWADYYRDNLEIKPDYRDIKLCIDILDILENNTLSDAQDILNSDIPEMLEKELTKYLIKSEHIINQKFESLSYAEEKLNNMTSDLGHDTTNLQKLEIAMYRDEEVLMYMIDKDARFCTGLSEIIHQDITNLGNAPLVLIMKYDNVLGISEDYKMHQYRVKEYFSNRYNLRDNIELQKIVLSNDSIFEKLITAQPLTLGEGQLIKVADRRFDTITMKDVDMMNEQERTLAQQIVDKTAVPITETVKDYLEPSNDGLFKESRIGEKMEDNPKLKEFFSQFKNISESANEEMLVSIVLDSGFIKHNILNDIPMSSGQKQLIDLANKEPGEEITIDDVDKLDLDNLELASFIVDTLDLEPNQEVLNFSQEIDTVVMNKNNPVHHMEV